MAARLTDEQKNQIIADYVETGSYRATAKKFGISDNTVKRLCAQNAQIAQKCAHKKEQNTADILAYMESKRDIVCEILGKGLSILNDEEKLREASPAQITTAMGTLIDKWAMISGGPADSSKEDELSRSLRALNFLSSFY